ncbi:MAG: sigma-70 family RNA polymerase sigma factor [Bacteroidales bacterium]|nr:sigma-70 family RNA polymerase sigma factor [Bacteroidales bacterium]
MTEQEQSFLNLVEQHKKLIYKVCFMYASDDESINDLYQEVVLNLWKSFPQFRGESKPITWIYRIAVNTCVSWIRMSSRKLHTVSLTVSMTELFADENEKENLRELYALINQLGKLERALILLWLDERSYEEIAQILDISVSNVGVRINRVKTKLKTMYNI